MIAERKLQRSLREPGNHSCAICGFCYAQVVADRVSTKPAQLFDLSVFRDQARARGELQALQARLRADAYAALPLLLSDLPNPGQALSFLERLTAESSEVMALLERDRVLLDYALLVFSHSYWLGETLVQNPDLFSLLAGDKNMERSFERDDFRASLARFRSRPGAAELSPVLARFKKREYVRITLRDLLGIATLAETAAEISALADVLIEAAVAEAQEEMRRRYGTPQQLDATGRRTEALFAVLAMGKLGGN